MQAPDEDDQLRHVALQNAQSIFQARRRAEDEIRTHSEWLRVTLASIADAVVSTDADGRISLMNAVAESLTGWTQADALGLPLSDVFRIVNAASRLPVENPALRALRDGAIVGLANSTLLIAKDGSERPIDDSAAPIRAASGEVIGAVLIFRDITDRKQAEGDREVLLESERSARADAERASLVKEEFLAMLSHELRTPLNAIVGWTQILRTKPPSADTLDQGLRVIDRNARIQAQLIANLLDMSRIMSGKLRIEMERVELRVVIEAALESVRAAAEAKGLTLESAVEPISGDVMGDPARLQQVVWNLLSNAIKFTASGGHVRVAAGHTGSSVEVSVSDTGKGIRAAFLPHVFERFRQADNSAAREHGGLGLGLAIVKQLVALHGGSVQASSPGENAGATFTVRLPIIPAGLTRQPVRLPAGEVHSAPDLAGVRVLVVDDDADARDLISRVLEERGAQVVTASSATDALAAIAHDAPDVILSDIGMPQRDGYTFMQAVRRSGLKVPAAALTAFARSEDRTRALEAGYQTHIAKPVEPVELVAAVAALLHRTSSRDQAARRG